MLRIQITTGSKIPIYRQIVNQIRSSVASGKIAVGTALPSVRALAGELVVNPNTIAKAYSALVRDGVLESHQGKGYFVAQRREIFSDQERQRRLDEAIGPLIAEALTLGFDRTEIVQAIENHLSQLEQT